MIWNFSCTWPTSLGKIIIKSTTILVVFSKEFFFLKCSCPVFCRAQKMISVNLNANISQSTQWKFLKFFPHILKSAYYKILRSHVSKKSFFQKFDTCTKNGSFEHFQWKYSHGTLGVKTLFSLVVSVQLSYVGMQSLN